VDRPCVQVVVYRLRVLKLRVQTTCSNRIAMPCRRAPMRTIPDSVGLSLRHHCHPAVLARLAHRSWSDNLVPSTWPSAHRCLRGSHRLTDASPRSLYSVRSSIHAACDWSHPPHQQAGHVTAPDQYCNTVRKSLPRRRPHVTQSGHERVRIATEQTDPEPHFVDHKSLL